MRVLPFLLLAGCLGPNIADICFSNTLLEDDLCDIDNDADDEENILEVCEQNAGYMHAIGCAGEAMVYAKCLEDVFNTNPDCEDIEEEDDVCAYELGRLNGCLDRNR